jgi:hypothetical protein
MRWDSKPRSRPKAATMCRTWGLAPGPCRAWTRRTASSSGTCNTTYEMTKGQRTVRRPRPTSSGAACQPARHERAAGMAELSVLEARQVVTNLEVRETRPAPDVSSGPNCFRRVEVRCEHADAIGAIGWRRRTTPVHRRATGGAEVADPLPRPDRNRLRSAGCRNLLGGEPLAVTPGTAERLPRGGEPVRPEYQETAKGKSYEARR